MNAAVQATVRKTAHRPTPAEAADKLPGKTGGRRLQVKRSGVHGQGVFALMPIAAGETIIEYTGEVISWPEARRRHPHAPSPPDHTF